MPFVKSTNGDLKRNRFASRLPGPKGQAARQWLAEYYRAMAADAETKAAAGDECMIIAFGRDYYVAGAAIGANEREAVKLSLGITGRLTAAHLERANYTVINGRWIAPEGAETFIENTGTDCPF